jgi:NAD-dependent dihydropyrimidine dehydrogenase PreA subunit
LSRACLFELLDICGRQLKFVAHCGSCVRVCIVGVFWLRRLARWLLL